jgi:cobalt/nickel transport system permease protein
MSGHLLDPYRAGHSPLHRLDPRVKFAWTLAFILTAASLPDGAWPMFILLFSLTLSATVASELGPLFVLRRGFVALPFALAAAGVLFTLPGPTLWRGALGPWTFTITSAGVERFFSILLKSWLSIQAAILLTATTTFPDILQAMRALRVPRLLVAIFGLMWRYLFLLVNEAMGLMQARAARSADPDGRGGGSIAWRARVAGGMAASLFLRSFERGERIYAAMLARGYDGEVRGLPLVPLPTVQGMLLMGVLVVFGLLEFLAHWVW